MSATDEALVYTGEGGAEVPQNVVRVLVDPSVSSILDFAFYARKKLAEVELCEGLVEIGEQSFGWCDLSIMKINIPNSLRRIKYYAFRCSLRTPIRLHDGIESIGTAAFGACIFTNFRVPPLITVIPNFMLIGCKSTFSLELPETVIEIGNGALQDTYCLRNVAFPPNAVFGYNIFSGATDLYQLFGNSDARIISELQHRFDALPIHKLVYYHLYHQGVLQNLIPAINMRSGQRRTLRVLQVLIAAMNMRSGQRRTLRSKLDRRGDQQDCLGMTPLHILACSSVHDIEVYRLIVEKYPANLITEDRWGALPLLYAFWGAAPAEIIQFLLASYQSLYPDHVFNWTMMVETMGRCDTPKGSIENLLQVKQMHFPDQPIDWEYLLEMFASPSHYSFDGLPFQERMQFLVMCGMSEHVESLAFKVWRDHITNIIYTANFQYNGDNFGILRWIFASIAHFEDEYPKLKEITTILELALWKLRMNENIPQEEVSHCHKKMKADDASIRWQCRVTGGADVIIGHVLPFLINTGCEAR